MAEWDVLLSTAILSVKSEIFYQRLVRVPQQH